MNRDDVLDLCAGIPGAVEDGALREMVQHSYDLVLDGLPRAQRERLAGH
jgi:predicted DNA-binding protein (MmcQ/YjbR family)